MAYFTADYLEFFRELAANNRKEWFDDNRKRYEQSVREPFRSLVGELIHRTGEPISPGDAIFRINRDIRFSADKSPYKTHMAAVISSVGRRDFQVPGLYLQLGGDHVWIGAGLHAPDRESLLAIRRAIRKKPGEFRKLLANRSFRRRFGELRGDRNKVLPAEFKTVREEVPEIANKQFFVLAEYDDPEIILRDDLVQWILAHRDCASGLNGFLATALKRRG